LAEYSVSDVPLIMNGGAVRLERSPEKEDIVFKNWAQDPEELAGTDEVVEVAIGMFSNKQIFS